MVYIKNLNFGVNLLKFVTKKTCQNTYVYDIINLNRNIRHKRGWVLCLTNQKRRG